LSFPGAHSGVSRREGRELCFSVIASEAKQSSLFAWTILDCFRGACHRARIRATRWLAMTLSSRDPRIARPKSCECQIRRPASIYQSTQKDQGTRAYFTFAPYHGLTQFNEKARDSMSTRLKIIAEMQRIAAEQQVTLPPLVDDLSLHETGFDSLAFAILVARLEDDLGIDPFTISEDASFPLTVGDFIRAYENVPA
jgi:acyl carrier protein